MIDIRYHITSLVAVFLALTIGVVIGQSVAPGAAKSLTTAIKKQTAQVDVVLAEYQRDHTVLGKLESALTTLVPSLVSGKLSGKRVAIIETGDRSEAVKAASDAIEAAGGDVASTTTLTSVFDQLTDDEKQRVSGEMADQPSTSDSQADLLRPIVQALQKGAPNGAALDTDLGILRRERLIESSGDYTLPVSMVVIVGGASQDTQLNIVQLAGRESQLVQALAADGTITVVGGELQDSPNSSILSLHNAGIATVDCLDRAIGKLDLVYALDGEKASYGVLPSADRVLPASIEQGESSVILTPKLSVGAGHEKASQNQ